MSHAERIHMTADGPEVSRIAYGVWRLLDDPEGAGVARVRAKIDACLEVGITTFDHADIYGGYECEAAFGAALKEAPRLRESMEIVTKCGIMLVKPARPGNRIKHYDYSRGHIVGSAERSLENLGVDTIDVLLLHRPSPLMDADEIAEAFRSLRRAGKVRHFGVSNFTPSQVRMLQSRLDQPLVTNQLELHPIRLAPFLDGTLDLCQELGMAPMAWSPSAGGRLLSQGPDWDGAVHRVRQVLGELSGRYGTTPDRILYAWLLAHPARIIPVVGSNRVERIAAAAGALEVALEVQDWFAIWCAVTEAPVP